MKKTFYLFTFIVLLNFSFPALECKGDTIVWSGNIELNADRLFNQQQTLKVMPGTVVTATGAFKIEIKGNILAEGTIDNPILFTATDTLGLYDSATVAGGWHGIHLLNNENGHAKFKHCRFEYGKANIPGSWYSYEGNTDTLGGNQGGAFRITDYKTTGFDNCTFLFNYSRSRGGALYCNHIQSIKITNCEFSQNKTMAYGGAICCHNHDSLHISNSTFKLNTALYYYISVLGHKIYHSKGSAIYLYTDYPDFSSNIINNSYFFNNTSLSTISFLVTNSIFFNNVLTNNFNLSTLTFNRLESSHRVFNNNISHNFFTVNIPGVYASSEDLRFYNNIMWNNFSLHIEDDDLAVNWLYYQPDVSYCLIWDGRAEGENIITNDPLFVNPAPGSGLDYNGWEYDWSLSDASPAVNAGTPDTTGLNLPAYDLAGNPRIFGISIDMGAYENQVVTGLPQNPLVSAKIEAVPNPFRNRFSINILPENKINRISIRNQSGITIKKMEQFPMSGWLVIDLQTYKPGLYVIVVEYANGTVEVKKMLKV